MPEDRGAVIDSWLKSYRCAHSAGLISMDRWADVMRVEIERLLDRSEVLIEFGDTGRQYGWICYEGDDLVHYMYTWDLYRKKGVAHRLLKASSVKPNFTYSCRTTIAEAIIRKWHPARRPRFNPLPARFGSRPRRKPDVQVEFKR